MKVFLQSGRLNTKVNTGFIPIKAGNCIAKQCGNNVHLANTAKSDL